MPAALLVALLPLPLTLAIAVIDLRRGIIPDRLNLALLGLGLAATAWQEPGLPALGARLGEAALAFGLFWGLRALHARLRGRVGLGLGDVKFLGAATAWTGLAGLPLLILCASAAALAVVGLAALSGRPVAGTTRLPFGPFLALGLHAALLGAPHPAAGDPWLAGGADLAGRECHAPATACAQATPRPRLGLQGGPSLSS